MVISGSPAASDQSSSGEQSWRAATGWPETSPWIQVYCAWCWAPVGENRVKLMYIYTNMRVHMSPKPAWWLSHWSSDCSSNKATATSGKFWTLTLLKPLLYNQSCWDLEANCNAHYDPCKSKPSSNKGFAFFICSTTSSPDRAYKSLVFKARSCTTCTRCLTHY